MKKLEDYELSNVTGGTLHATDLARIGEWQEALREKETPSARKRGMLKNLFLVVAAVTGIDVSKYTER